MVKSMFAGVASIKTHQSKFDVISNNIANVNTWGFKSASMSFKDTMYQSTSAGSSGDTKEGGYGAVNPNQVGYGVTTGSIAYDFGTGGMSPSANGLDCMIDGTGFFIVGPMAKGGSVSLDTDDAVKSSGLYLSRVGKFKVDPNGYLVDDSGNYVYGFTNKQLTGTPDYDKTSLSPLKIPTKAEMAEVAGKGASDKVAETKTLLEEARAAYNTANGLLGTARQEYFQANAVYQDTYTSKTVDALTTALKTAKDDMDKAYSEWNSKKDTTEGDALKTTYNDAKIKYDEQNFKLIQAQASLRCPKTLDTYTASNPTALDDIFTAYETAFNNLQAANPVTDAADYKTKNDALVTAKAALEKVQTALTKIEDDSPEGKLDAAELAVKAAESKVDTAKQNQNSAQSTYEAAQKANTTSTEKESGSTDDLEEFANYKIEQDGTIAGTSKDGVPVTIGKIALGGVANTGGLEKTSGYYYSIGASAGNVSVSEGGGREGKILGNYLEMSKVDLATEMTDMITTQRGYQAGTKIVTVTDEMLEELVNMKR